MKNTLLLSILLTVFSYFAHAVNFDDVHGQLFRVAAFPGQLFPNTCPKDFIYNGPEEERNYSYRTDLNCKTDLKESPAKTITFDRAGLRFTSSISVAVNVQKDFVCSEANLKAFLADKAKFFAFSSSGSKGETEYKASSLTIFPQMTVTIFCYERIDKNSLRMGIQTEYSDIGTSGEKVRTNSIDLTKTGSFEFPPYFLFRHGPVAERLEKAKVKIAEWKPRTDKLKGLAKTLYDDNVAMVTSKEFINGMADYASQQKNEEEKKATAPSLLDEIELDFISNTGCMRTCAYEATRGPNCKKRQEQAFKELEEVSKDPVKMKAKEAEMAEWAKKVQTMKSEEQRKAFEDLTRNQFSEACANEKKESLSKCGKACPGALHEASLTEVNNSLRYMKSSAESCRSDNKFASSQCSFFQNHFLGARMYKLGFLESKLKYDSPFLINTDQQLKNHPTSIKLFRGSRDIDFVTEAKRYCPDCTLEKTRFKILAIADPLNKKKYDVWTIDDKGNQVHVQDGFK